MSQLVKDLEDRGLLDTTLVIQMGEFGGMKIDLPADL